MGTEETKLEKRKCKRKRGEIDIREGIPTNVRIVPHLKSDLLALMKLFELDTPPDRLIEGFQSMWQDTVSVMLRKQVSEHRGKTRTVSVTDSEPGEKT